jgi:hypothetical protein
VQALSCAMARQPRSIQASARIARGWSLGFYVAGVAALGAGILVGGIVAAASGSGAGLAVAAIIAAAGAGTGGIGLWESRRFRKRAERLERSVSERRLVDLAAAHAGILRVTDVAQSLRIPREDAEELLDHLVDEVRVSMQVTDEGEIQYVFREVRRMSAAPRVRVADSDAVSVDAQLEADAEPGKRSSN